MILIMSCNNSLFLFCKWGMIISHNPMVIIIKSNHIYKTIGQIKYQVFLPILVLTAKVCLIVLNYHSSIWQHFGISTLITEENNMSIISLSGFRALYISLFSYHSFNFTLPTYQAYAEYLYLTEPTSV